MIQQTRTITINATNINMDNKIYNTTESVNYKILSRTQKKKIYNINNKYKEINNDRNYQYFKRY